MLPALEEDTPPLDNQGVLVGMLADMVAEDVDDMELGLAVTQSDQSNGIWQYRDGSETSWIDIPTDIATGEILQLRPESWVRFLPDEHFFGESQFTAHAWDLTNQDVDSGVVNFTSSEDVSGPYSAAIATIGISVLHINDPPIVILQEETVTYIENEPVQLFGDLLITDVDSTELQSATLVLDCPTCVPADQAADSDDLLDFSGMSFNAVGNDVILSQHAASPYRMELVSRDALQSVFEIRPVALGDGAISRFTQYLQTLHFANRDLEITGSPRFVSLTVSDGINSSVPVGVGVAIMPVNDETPIISLPLDVDYVYVENSGVMQLFDVDMGPMISDNDQDNPIYSATIRLMGGDQETINVTCPPLLTCSLSSEGIDISGEASIADYNLVLGSLTYENFAEEPEAGSSVITLVVSDGQSSSPEVSLSVRTELINDQLPVISPQEDTVVFMERNPMSPPVAFARNLQVMDTDSGMFFVASVQATLTDPLDDGLERIGLMRNLRFPRSVAVDRSDPYVVTISVAEGGVDMNGDPLPGLPPRVVQMFLQGLRYLNMAEQPSGENRTIVVVVSDNFTLTGLQESEPAVVVVTFQQANDPPMVQLNAGIVMYSEGQSPREVGVAPDAVVSDIDNANIMGVVIELTAELPGNDITQEVLRVSLPDDGSVSNDDDMMGESGSGSGRQLITLSGEASVGTYTAILRTLTYEHTITAGDPDPGIRLISVTPLGLDGEEGVGDVVSIAFNATDDPPLLDLNGPLPGRDHMIIFYEEGEPIYVTSSDFVLEDVDSEELESVSITLYASADEEMISINSDSLDVMVQADSASSILLTGPAPVEEFASILLSLQYVNLEDEPSEYPRNVSIVASDGNGQVTQNTIIYIELVNDAPIVFLNRSDENSQVVFVENGPPVALSVDPQVIDPDSELIELRIRPLQTSAGDVLTVDGDLTFDEGYYFVSSSSSFSTAEAVRIISSVTYSNGLPEPAPGVRVFCFSVLDDQELPSAEVCSYVSLSFVNDNTPFFQQSQYEGAIEENTASTPVVTVLATDADSANTQFDLVYSIVSGDDCMDMELDIPEGSDEEGSGSFELGSGVPTLTIPPSQPCRFTIDSSSGQISTSTSPPDREMRQQYLLTVAASDGTFEGRAVVNISIIDVVDEAPRFQPSFYSVTIPLGAQAGFVLEELSFFDPDINENVMVVLVSLEPSRRDVFNVDTSGVVSLLIPETELDLEVSQYLLTFSAFDAAFIEASNSAQLEVNVILNNADPVFDTQSYTATISELEVIGASVLTVTAMDADTGSNAELSYSFEGDVTEQPPFAINSSNGDISLLTTLDFEVTQEYMFVVVVSDNGRRSRSGSASVSVYVLNENEDRPTFTQDIYSASVCEGVPLGYELLTVLAEDSDAGTLGEVRYVIVDEENSQGRIKVNDSTGVVSVDAALDFEDDFRSFVVSVQAIDGGGEVSTEAQVSVNLLNDNEFAPEFQMSVFEVIIPENYPIDRPLPFMGEFLEAIAEDADACNVDQCEGGVAITNDTCSGSSGLQYNITDDDFFKIDPDTGIVYLSNSLDFENSRHRSFTLDLQVDDGQFSSSAILIVNVTDFNDNLPMFTESEYSTTIPELLRIGTTIRTVEATDADPTSVILYSLSGEGSGDFNIGPTSGVVTTAVQISFEVMSEYKLYVTATNPATNDSEETAVTTFFDVQVTDVNNNPPVFSEESYTFFLQENAAPDSRIGMVMATDQDSGENAELVYSIGEVVPDGGNEDLFYIDLRTGELFSLVVFDREFVDSYTLTVWASDSGLVPLATSVEVVVMILDENDNTPMFGQEQYTPAVDEDAAVGSMVATLSVTDADDANMTVLAFEISSGNELGHFSIDQVGVVFVASELDRETVESYVLTVTVTDSAEMPRASTVAVYITVNDVNDNTPSFPMETFNLSIPEDVQMTFPPSYPFLTISATDIDAGDNATIIYSLSDEDTPFTIGTEDGVVRVRSGGVVDRETVDFYSLQVTASNPDGVSSTASLEITILDVNDNAPEFISRRFEAEIDEDFTPVVQGACEPNDDFFGSGSGSGLAMSRYVATVMATDDDEASTSNSEIAYTLVSVTPQADFTIDSSTGDVFVSQLLDRECFGYYNLTLEASNTDDTMFRDMAILSVFVTDINDNSPLFEEESYSVSISEGIRRNVEFLRVAAMDADAGTNAALKYAIASGSSPFEIDQSTGRLYVTADLDREAVPAYSFVVSVEDSGAPPMSGNVTVDVVLLDVNDNGPMLTPTYVTVTLDENLPIGTTIVNFTVTDADIGSNAESVLHLSGAYSNFAIEGRSLVVSGVLDFETNPRQEFEVVATNVASPNHTNASLVIVTLNNLNDNPPIVTYINPSLRYLEGNRRLSLDVGATIVDDDGVNITMLVDGIIEFNATDPRDPSIPFSPNTFDQFLPYDCPLEDEKRNKFGPCNLPVDDDHFFTNPDVIRRGLRNLKEEDIVSSTLTLNASLEQYASRSIDSNLLETGLTMSTWVWLERVTDISEPQTIVSKVSPTLVLYSVSCSGDGQDLVFHYQANTGEGEDVVFADVCGLLQGAWNHLAVIVDNSDSAQWTVAVLVNAELAGRRNISTPTDEPGSVFVGTRPDGGVNAVRKDFFSGRIHLLLFSYTSATENEVNCAIGCGSALISTLRTTPLYTFYDYTRRTLVIVGRQPVSVYEDLLNSIVAVLPLLEPVTSSYGIAFTVQDEEFNCLPTFITIILIPVNDFQPFLSITGETPPSDFSAVFVEEAGPVAVVNESSLILTDGDLVAFPYVITVEILNPEPQGSQEVLEVNNIFSDMNISDTYIDYTLTIAGNMPLPLFEMILRTITYNNLDDEPSGSSRQLRFTVTDVPEEDVRAFTSIDIVLVNDVPVLSVVFSTTEYSEGDGMVSIIQSIGIDDSDNATLVAGQISFNIIDLGAEVLSVDASSSAISWEYDDTTGVLSLVGEDTQANYSSVIRSLVYGHMDMTDPSLGARVFHITVSDGLATSSDGPAGRLYFSAVNDPPVVDLNGAAMGEDFEVTFVEDVTTIVAAVSPLTTLVDVDDTLIANVTITLTPVLDGEDETLIVTAPQEEGMVIELSGVELILTSSDPLPTSAYQTVLRSLQYQNLADEPTPGVRVIEVVAHDGEDEGPVAFARVTVREANDAPLLDIDPDSAQPGYETVFEEEGGAVFITSGNTSIVDGDVGASIDNIMVVIQNALDGLDEMVVSTDPLVNITVLFSSTSSVFMIVPSDGSLMEAEDLLNTLQYQNQRAEPSSEPRFISISVSDGISFSNTEIVRVQIDSTNEHRPQFEQPRYSRSIEEELGAEVSIATVRAVDQDAGPDGNVTYDIVSSAPSEGEGQFRIDSVTGVVYTTMPLDRENVDFYTLNISASDNGAGPSLMDYATVQVTVLDINDQIPQFQGMAEFSIREDVAVGFVVTTLMASDGDAGENARVTYSIGEDDSLFEVLPDGQLVVAAELDADIPNPVYLVSVVATDNGTSPLSNEIVVTVTVEDVNDNNPRFSDSGYSVQFPENLPIGTIVGIVTATDLDSGTNGEITYMLETFGDPPGQSDFFTIDPATGAITTLVSLDFEDEEVQNFRNDLFLTAVDNGMPPLGSLRFPVRFLVEVTDVNDNAPRFSGESYAVTIDENIPVGELALTVMATDEDMGSNAQFNYSIVPNSQVSPLFGSDALVSIDPQTGEIFVNAVIDFELQPFISFVVEAEDMGSPSLTGSAEVTITVRDLNDNDPQFNQSLYEVSIPEDAPTPSVLLSVFATDADSNENGDVSYTLVDSTNTFAIDVTTGAISNILPLDFESVCFYRLLVTASDDGEPIRNSSVMVYVTVLPVHDVPPMFQGSSYSRTIPENRPLGTSILQVVAVDGDTTSCSETEMFGSGSGDSLIGTEEPQVSNFEFVLLNHNDVFAIDSETGLITNQGTLDREVTPQYTLLVQARDPLGLSAEVPVTVTLLDLNDNPPMFTQPLYAAVLLENAPVGLVVVQVTATDPDSIDEGRITYSLRDQTEFFAIDNRTGDIYVAGEIDFDTLGGFVDLIAIATDSASNAAAAVIQLVIGDQNDIPPLVVTPPVTLTFTEGDISLTPFPEVSIIDSDSFQLLCSATVELSSASLGLNTMSECSCSDVDSTSSCDDGCYEFIQLPSDSFPGAVLQSGNGTVLNLVGNHSISTYVSAIEAIQYINLIPNPIPDSRTISLYVFDCELHSNTLTNTINIEALNVFPPEVDLNGPSQVGNDFNTTFRERGPQVAIASPDALIIDEDTVREREELTGLDVWITNPQDGDSESLVVSPPFTHDTITFTRNSAHSISFAGVGLLSDYSDILTQIFYSNEESEPTSSPGRVVRVIAHEYHLSSDAAMTTIQLVASNDHPPVILTAPPLINRMTSFREGSNGTPLTTNDAVITDQDSSIDLITELQAHVVSPNKYDSLYLHNSVSLPLNIDITILSNSSIVFTGAALPSEYETVMRGLQYQFTGDEIDYIFPGRFVYLELTDAQYSTFSAVLISLEPVNDQQPIFTQDVFMVEVSEDAAAGESIAQLTATDGDRFSESDFVYSIQEGNDESIFAIFPENGTLYLSRGLDFEMAPVHRLIVGVVDLDFVGDSSPSANTAMVTITLRDVNDQVPMFSMREYNATVGEGVPIGTLVLQVFASDEDTEEHSELEFELVGTADFSIDQETGVIFTSADIDREGVAFYSFFVNVRNPGTAAFDSARVSITVLDLDDNAPSLILDPASNVLIEPEISVTLASDLEITDEDPNPSLDYAIVQVLSTNGTDAIGELLALVDSQVISISGNGSSMLIFTGESQPLDEYESVLRGVVYQDVSSEPVDVDRVVAYQVGSNLLPGLPIELLESDGETISNVSLFTVGVSLINDQVPELSLDERPQDPTQVLPQCEDVAGSYSVEYVEDSSPVLLAHSSLDIKDSDSGDNTIAYAVVSLQMRDGSGLERLSVDLPSASQASLEGESGFPLTSVSLDERSDDYTIVLTGPATHAEFEEALQSVM